MTLPRDVLLSVLHGIDAYDFESVVAELWERQGWTTTVTQGSNDRGVDVIAERSDPFAQKIAIQAKRYNPSSSVGSPEVQQYASLRQQVERVDSVVIVTTGQFSKQARETADKLNVKLVNGEQLYDIFDTNAAFDVLYPYMSSSETGGVTGSSDESSAGHDDAPAVSESDIQLNSNFDVGSKQEPDPDPDVITLDYEVSGGEREPPESLADLIDLQETIRDEFKKVAATADDAEAAFNRKEFHAVVDVCVDGQEGILDLESDITRYEQGFERADVTATEHLTSPREFESMLTERRAQFDRLGSEAGEMAEQADALERLAEEVEEDAERAKRLLAEGDKARNRREYDRAQQQYEDAMAALQETNETLETYHSLANEYERAVPVDAPKPPTGVSLEQLDTALTERLDEEEGRVVERDFQVEATDNSVTNRLMNETYTGAGFTNQPAANYLEPDEVPHFCFYSKSKGYTHESADGDKERNRPESDYGCLYLLTDRRVLILTGQEEGDTTTVIPRPVLSEYSVGRLKNRLTLLPDWDEDGEKYHLWIDSSYEEDTLKSAKEYLLPGGEVDTTGTGTNTSVPETEQRPPRSDGSKRSVDANSSVRLTEISGVGTEKADMLVEAGYETVDDIRRASQSELANVSGIENALAARMKADVEGLDVAEETDVDVVHHDDTMRGSNSVNREPVEPGRQDADEGPDQSPSEIVDRAEGSFSESILTKTDSRLIDQRLVDYLLPDEKLEYVLWHQYKGLRIIHPNGTEETPHHDTSTDGSRFLLVTDRQVCYVAGLNEHDEIRTFDYAEMTDAEATSNLMSQWITLSIDDGTDVRFAETGTHANDVSDVAEYVRSHMR